MADPNSFNTFDLKLLSGLQARLPKPGGRARKKLDTAMRDLTSLGGDVFSGLVLLAGLLILSRESATGSITVFAGMMASARLIGWLMKKLFKRERPPLHGHTVETFTSSFPSIHTEMGFVSSFAIAMFLTAGHAGNLGYVTPLLVAGLVSAIIGFSRLYFSVHWPSDVLAGWLLGLGICSASMFF